MTSDYSLEAVAKVIAYGVPAILILLGFIAYVGGYSLIMLSGDVRMTNFGIALIVIGVIIYIVEFLFKVYVWLNE